MSDRELLELLLEKVTNIASEQKQFRAETIGRFEKLESELNKQAEKQELIFNQTAKLTEYHSETMERLDSIREDQKSIHEILGGHEVAIRTLRRKPV